MDVSALVRACVSVALLTATIPAQAVAARAAVAPAERSAEDEYHLGEQAYALGNYEQAVGHFERSYALSDQPDLLFNIGQSYYRLYELSQDPRHLRKARALFSNYLKFLAASEALDETTRASVEQHITDIDSKLAALAEADKPDPEPDPDPPDDEQDPEPEGPKDAEPGPTEPVDEPAPEKKPLYKKGWFWGALIGAVAVAGGVTAAILLTRDSGDGIPEPELGTIPRVGPGPALAPGGVVFSF